MVFFTYFLGINITEEFNMTLYICHELSRTAATTTARENFSAKHSPEGNKSGETMLGRFLFMRAAQNTKKVAFEI